MAQYHEVQLEAKAADGDKSAQNLKEYMYLRHSPPSTSSRFRARVAAAFQQTSFQAVLAAVVFLNVTAMCFQTQLMPAKGSLREKVLYGIEITCTCVYILELLINLFASWFWDFVSSAWNWFDVVVIAASAASFYGIGPAGTSTHTHTHTHTNTHTQTHTHKHTHTHARTHTRTHTHTQGSMSSDCLAPFDFSGYSSGWGRCTQSPRRCTRAFPP